MFPLTNSLALSKRGHELIPAAAHTYSKGDDQFPENSPRFIERGTGCHVWDVDGNEFIDWGMGLRSVILGHAYPCVVAAVKNELDKGSNFTRPSPLEIELAELLHGLIPSAEMVKFGKNGSDVTSAAVRLARAHTKRDKIVYCKDHPFFSVNDWFIGTTSVSAGVPKAVSDLSIYFRYNDLESLKRLFEQNPDSIAGVIMEVATSEEPKPGFLEGVKKLCHQHGAVLIFDEMITGFRWHLKGAQTLYGVTPDLSCFGKGLGNGFSVSALCGKKEIMERGGLLHTKERVFLLSQTHGGETHALAAAIATVREMQEKDVIAHLWKMGRLLKGGFNQRADEHRIADHCSMGGYDCSPVLTLKDLPGDQPLTLRTLFLQEMINKQIIIPYIALSFSHTEKEIEATLAAVDDTLRICAAALAEKNVRARVNGAICKPVFRTYN